MRSPAIDSGSQSIQAFAARQVIVVYTETVGSSMAAGIKSAARPLAAEIGIGL